MNPTDEYGLCPENTFITIFIPATSKALVFRVKARVNRRYEVMKLRSPSTVEWCSTSDP
jgi:hypothetical protein